MTDQLQAQGTTDCRPGAGRRYPVQWCNEHRRPLLECMALRSAPLLTPEAVEKLARAVAVGISIPGHAVCQHRMTDIAAIINGTVEIPTPKEEQCR